MVSSPTRSAEELQELLDELGVVPVASLAHTLSYGCENVPLRGVNGHWFLPTGGHGFSPRTVTRTPRGRSRDSSCCSVCEWFHPLAGGGVGESDGFAVGDDEVGVVHQAVN